ncbi:MAG: hypothetical protein JSS49_08270 [Planctomycetes bacterium]|nr:hypothetical protein [Planctomycetota bacterium]
MIDEVCRRILVQYEPRVSPLRVAPLENRGGFSGASIWRVVTEQGDFALRCWPGAGLSRSRILGLHRLLEDLGHTGLPFVAVPLTGRHGSTLIRDAGRDWQLEPWLPGTADFHDRPTRDRLRAAMVALGQWHLAAEVHRPEHDVAAWFGSQASAPSPAVAERLGVLDHANEARLRSIENSLSQANPSPIRDTAVRILSLFRRGQRQIHDQLLRVCETEVRLQPCLRDVWHDHLLFRQDELTGLIDPSACRRENVTSDLARLIGSLVGDNRSEWEFALNEYQKLRPLTIRELTLVDALNRSGVLLSGWTWLEWLYLDRRTFADQIAVQRRLNELQRRMEMLTD